MVFRTHLNYIYAWRLAKICARNTVVTVFVSNKGRFFTLLFKNKRFLGFFKCVTHIFVCDIFGGGEVCRNNALLKASFHLYGDKKKS